MQSYLLSYDLDGASPDLHSQFLAQSKKQGWTSWIVEASPGGKSFQLPQTTLTGTFASFPAARAAFDNAKSATATAAGKEVIIKKWIIAEQGGAVFDSDVTQPHL
jgi:hypothetical protein